MIDRPHVESSHFVALLGCRSHTFGANRSRKSVQRSRPSTSSACWTEWVCWSSCFEICRRSCNKYLYKPNKCVFSSVKVAWVASYCWERWACGVYTHLLQSHWQPNFLAGDHIGRDSFLKMKVLIFWLHMKTVQVVAGRPWAKIRFGIRRLYDIETFMNGNKSGCLVFLA